MGNKGGGRKGIGTWTPINSTSRYWSTVLKTEGTQRGQTRILTCDRASEGGYSPVGDRVKSIAREHVRMYTEQYTGYYGRGRGGN